MRYEADWVTGIGYMCISCEASQPLDKIIKKIYALLAKAAKGHK